MSSFRTVSGPISALKSGHGEQNREIEAWQKQRNTNRKQILVQYPPAKAQNQSSPTQTMTTPATHMTLMHLPASVLSKGRHLLEDFGRAALFDPFL